MITVTGRPIEEMVIDYDLGLVSERAERRRRLFRSRMISLAITVVVVIVLAVWLRSQGHPFGLWLSVVIIAISAAWAIVYYLIYRRARTELGELRPGTAIRIGRSGVEVAGLSAGWADVAAISAAGGGLGRSPRLSLRLTDGRSASLALDQVTVLPATLDSTVRAYSGGRHGVDLTALDN